MSRQNSRFTDRVIIKVLIGALVGIGICLTIFAFGGYDSQILENKMEFLVQILGSALLGVICNGGAVVYEIDSWGVTKATIIHYIASLVAFLIACVFLHWFPKEYFLPVIFAFTLIYIGIWLINFITWRNTIRQMNADLERMIRTEREGGEHL
ncbi:DUF3021 domain-containing protein [Pseudobutyrivibrio sp.]